jgi:hypothetical protein
MRWAFEAYASGDWTVRRLLDELTARGLTSRPSRSRPSRPLTVSHLARLLHHPYYTGVVVYRGVEYRGRHEPLVDDELWQAVQDRLAVQGFAAEKQRVHPHYLKGSVFCGQCGSRLIVSYAVNRHGKTYPYFLCLGRQQRRTDCRQKAMPIDRVEELVAEHYRTIGLDEATTEQLRHHLRAEFTTANERLLAERSRQRKRHEELLAERQ